jgi:hypothetical protein
MRPSGEYQALRKTIKRALIQQQFQRCCHCDQRTPSNDLSRWDLEHFLPKGKYPQFSFTPENLAVSCADCNKIKGTHDTLKGNPPVRYPKASSRFKMVHPHLDSWKVEIDRVGYVYYANSAKGRETIYVCQLDRLAQLEAALPSRPLEEDFEGEISDLLGGFLTATELMVLIRKVRRRSAS